MKYKIEISEISQANERFYIKFSANFERSNPFNQ